MSLLALFWFVFHTSQCKCPSLSCKLNRNAKSKNVSTLNLKFGFDVSRCPGAFGSYVLVSIGWSIRPPLESWTGIRRLANVCQKQHEVCLTDDQLLKDSLEGNSCCQWGFHAPGTWWKLHQLRNASRTTSASKNNSTNSFASKPFWFSSLDSTAAPVSLFVFWIFTLSLESTLSENKLDSTNRVFSPFLSSLPVGCAMCPSLQVKGQGN